MFKHHQYYGSIKSTFTEIQLTSLDSQHFSFNSFCFVPSDVFIWSFSPLLKIVDHLKKQIKKKDPAEWRCLMFRSLSCDIYSLVEISPSLNFSVLHIFSLSCRSLSKLEHTIKLLIQNEAREFPKQVN